MKDTVKNAYYAFTITVACTLGTLLVASLVKAITEVIVCG